MNIKMDLYQLTNYLQKCEGYELSDAECIADFFYERGWDEIDVDSYLCNSNFQIIPPDEDVNEYLKNGDSEDYIIFKAFNNYVYLEFY